MQEIMAQRPALDPDIVTKGDPGQLKFFVSDEGRGVMIWEREGQRPPAVIELEPADALRLGEALVTCFGDERPYGIRPDGTIAMNSGISPRRPSSDQ